MGLKDTETLPAPAAAPAEPTRGRRNRWTLLLGVALLAGLRLFAWSREGQGWLQAILNPRTTLFWYPCPDDSTTLCSFLTVPLDYTDPRPNETVSLALRMIPATVPPKEQLGYLFTNPGGPGGSGTAAVASYGGKLAAIVEGRYNVLSWDPRSVNLTAPAVGCFATDGDANRFLRDIEHLGLPFAEYAWTVKLDAFEQALASSCDPSAAHKIVRASSTAFVARDMKRILEALGEKKLSYWGFSYGTILGATFSAMFPDLVERVILDGVSDADSYTNDLWEWGRSGMADTRKASLTSEAQTFEGFFSACAKSGPAGCAFAIDNSTAEELEDRYHDLLEKLRQEPLPVSHSDVGPGILSPSDVEYTVFHALPNLARLLVETERGNGTSMYATANVASGKLARKDPARHNPFHRAMSTGSIIASTAAIMCSDTDPEALRDSSTRTLGEYMHDLRKETKSPTADIWAIWISTCRHWKAKAIETYRGPWTVAGGLKKTNFPIIFFSQTADPVTPLKAAEKMAAGFGNSSATLVKQNGFGHCSLAHPSLCTAKIFRSYFLEGKVPAWNTTCDSDDGFLFPHPNAKVQEVEALSAEDAALRRQMWDLSQSFKEARTAPL
ncbi:alpha/beta hydrolase, peptidase [Rhodotorula toruloides NP11]|uniref:Alpha/beta hydrolase, peptidase n=1 Tax=Rhodotorula toruloides (strain NP11) TaxID=1130832 RepID=M7X1W1_RHOT1|nr:alpha/beta hydrolase, peptidase [Rhodotorula toruloides NP11]EMS24286.1 alpha/beta hydrolase, peptidase [Rhodotorula toruloides NP11]